VTSSNAPDKYRSEQEFANSFIRNCPASVWTRVPAADKHVKFAVESTCSDGRADWVWASSDSCWEALPIRDASDLLQNPTCSRILSNLKRIEATCESVLLERIGISKATLRRFMNQLSDVGLVAIKNDRSYVLDTKWKLPKVEIVAFEFKLSDWKRAFYQATRYRTFAHRVYVVMPSYHVGRTTPLHDSFRTQNIGLISYDESEAIKILPSLKRNPKSASSFLQAIGMLTS
jgi:DNA-binding transcriptional ArsR family regulator